MAALNELMIVDTGCANLASVQFACERLGVDAKISADCEALEKAERLILPGVGAAGAAMKALQRNGLDEMLTSFPRPLLGICLGMQVLFDKSHEGDTRCLGLLGGTVQAIPDGDGPVPHMGWNTLDVIKPDPLLDGIKDGAYVYFVHSFAVKPDHYTLASTEYGMAFSAIIRKNNIYGCQFHPERSGSVGAQILKNFMGVNP